MKRLIIFLFVLMTISVKAQRNYNNGRTCDFILVQGDTSLITGFNGLDKKDFGIYLGVRYGGLFSGSIFYTPFNSINRLGISKGYMKDGIRLSGGIKITPIGTNSFDLRPEFGVSLHPIRLISQDPNSFDIVLSYFQSTSARFGFGVSFPIQYRNNFRL
jgi:hypothetical protein